MSRFAQPFLFRICMLCAYTRPRYQVSVFQDHWSSGSSDRGITVYKQMFANDRRFKIKM